MDPNQADTHTISYFDEPLESDGQLAAAGASGAASKRGITVAEVAERAARSLGRQTAALDPTAQLKVLIDQVAAPMRAFPPELYDPNETLRSIERSMRPLNSTRHPCTQCGQRFESTIADAMRMAMADGRCRSCADAGLGRKSILGVADYGRFVDEIALAERARLQNLIAPDQTARLAADMGKASAAFAGNFDARPLALTAWEAMQQAQALACMKAAGGFLDDHRRQLADALALGPTLQGYIDSLGRAFPQPTFDALVPKPGTLSADLLDAADGEPDALKRMVGRVAAWWRLMPDDPDHQLFRKMLRLSAASERRQEAEILRDWIGDGLNLAFAHDESPQFIYFDEDGRDWEADFEAVGLLVDDSGADHRMRPVELDTRTYWRWLCETTRDNVITKHVGGVQRRARIAAELHGTQVEASYCGATPILVIQHVEKRPAPRSGTGRFPNARSFEGYVLPTMIDLYRKRDLPVSQPKAAEAAEIPYDSFKGYVSKFRIDWPALQDKARRLAFPS